MTKPRLSSIVAMAQNNVIGGDNKLLWHISEDLKHFKRTTMGKPMIMGRKTFESFGGKPLPGRDHIVISRTPQDDESRVFWVSSIDEAIAKASTLNDEEIFITGGGEIYKQTLETIDRLYITIVGRDYAGDTTFPDFNWDDWIITEERPHDGDPSFTIYVLDKKTD